MGNARIAGRRDCALPRMRGAKRGSGGCRYCKESRWSWNWTCQDHYNDELSGPNCRCYVLMQKLCSPGKRASIPRLTKALQLFNANQKKKKKKKAAYNAISDLCDALEQSKNSPHPSRLNHENCCAGAISARNSPPESPSGSTPTD